MRVVPGCGPGGVRRPVRGVGSSLKANEENNVYQETELSSAENGPETVVQELEVPDEDTSEKDI